MMALSHFVILSVVLAAAAAEVTTFKLCNGVSTDYCSISQVRISPCKKVGNCVLPRGENSSLSFDFTPNFSTSNLKTMVFKDSTAFSGMTDNACDFTTCPSQAGVPQTLTYQLYIGQKLPKGTYTITWKLWNGNNATQVCCFLTGIKLKKPNT